MTYLGMHASIHTCPTLYESAGASCPLDLLRSPVSARGPGGAPIGDSSPSDVWGRSSDIG